MANRRVMFLCAHNQSRSVTGEGLLTGEKGFETRSRALWKGQKRKVTIHDGQWATEVYVMMPGMKAVAMEAGIPEKKIRSLWIPDNFVACEIELIKLFRTQLKPFGIDPKKSNLKAQQDCYKILDRKMGWAGGWGRWEWGEEFLPTKKESPRSDYGFDYVPLREPITREQMLAEFGEAKAFHETKEAEKEREATKHLFAEDRVKNKELQEKEMLEALEKYTKHVQKLFE